MLSTAVIIFREVLEAALIISIVMAASRGVSRRSWWVWGGVLAGLLASCVVAGFAGKLAEAAAGAGQELFNAGVLFSAVIMLGWHNIWMKQHGREIAQEMNRLGHAVVSGERPLHALVLVVGLAVLREGAEVVLFLYGIASAESNTTASMLLGGLLGLVAGGLAGLALYFGLSRVPARHLFTVTGGLILFLASGLAAQGAALLVQADWLPPMGHDIWDLSGVLPEDGLPGQILHALVGYVSRPDGVQIVFYLGTLLGMAGLMRLADQRARPSR